MKDESSINMCKSGIPPTPTTHKDAVIGVWDLPLTILASVSLASLHRDESSFLNTLFFIYFSYQKHFA